MQSVPREWLDFLRQQFPKDSRIQLTEIGGNPRPISPGSTGKLDYIDDAGHNAEFSIMLLFIKKPPAFNNF